MLPRVIKVNAEPDYKIELLFNNGETKQFNVRPYLDYTVYKPLKEVAFFFKVRVCNGTVCWGDKMDVDFDPDTLYLESVPVS